ncbi:alpha/beta hydrolase [Mycobacterium sp.]|jgi:acetyl esterase/lipase|uniref:alpha/beta hydrolase n=1 Tax=Mycobacterium sp. TaxID=1785 RepID=UPI002D63BEBE|nr:alpha/beta hydrolase [Mycobacterium sp.]HZA11670.1 alpha/beta hydrolase [Mycobacterium sp.]
MTAPSKVSDSPRTRIRPGSGFKTRRFSISDGAPVEVIEDGPGIAGRLVALGARLTIRPTLAIGSYLPFVPWPWGLVDLVSRAVSPIPGTIRATIRLPHCTAQLVRADGVLPADGTRRVILYMHGGAFLTCGPHTHGRLATMLSKFADAPVLVVNYRLMPKHSVGEAIDDCQDGWRWLRELGYEPDQIVLAGDSAGGYLGLTLAERLLDENEEPAALVSMSPLMELAKEAKQAHPNIHSDAMFTAKVFDAFVELIARAAARRVVDGKAEEVYEPLEHLDPGLPRTLIHVSGAEVLLYDARLAARKLAASGVPAELHIWPGQMHVFQIAAPLVPEATRSLRQIGAYIREATE